MTLISFDIFELFSISAISSQNSRWLHCQKPFNSSQSDKPLNKTVHFPSLFIQPRKTAVKKHKNQLCWIWRTIEYFKVVKVVSVNYPSTSLRSLSLPPKKDFNVNWNFSIIIDRWSCQGSRKVKRESRLQRLITPYFRCSFFSPISNFRSCS